MEVIALMVLDKKEEMAVNLVDSVELREEEVVEVSVIQEDHKVIVP